MVPKTPERSIPETVNGSAIVYYTRVGKRERESEEGGARDGENDVDKEEAESSR